jgi:hypothetical protein
VRGRPAGERRDERFSVADGEAGALVGRLFEFVDHGDGVVLHGNAAAALCVCDELVGAQAKFAGAGYRLEEAGGAEVGPVDVGFFEKLQRFFMRSGDGNPFGGKMAGLEDGDHQGRLRVILRRLRQ